MRPTTMRRSLLLPVLFVLAACGADDEPVRSAPGSTVEPAGAVELTVTLWHCGVEPVTVADRSWEVPVGESVDGHPDLPLDATNTPTDWVGSGTAVVAEDEMTYTDDGGEVVTFVPGDGEPPGPCA
jgi:hypothetical protein